MLITFFVNLAEKNLMMGLSKWCTVQRLLVCWANVGTSLSTVGRSNKPFLTNQKSREINEWAKLIAQRWSLNRTERNELLTSFSPQLFPFLLTWVSEDANSIQCCFLFARHEGDHPRGLSRLYLFAMPPSSRLLSLSLPLSWDNGKSIKSGI